ncbi:elastin-like [Falco peregrinus]|uniref:elastin-like n=1 Tax=Falco peregrinus TaxID=8954 RepID=UPI0024799CAE|nr:elastin-like [Falco peregrinus]
MAWWHCWRWQGTSEAGGVPAPPRARQPPLSCLLHPHTAAIRAAPTCSPLSVLLLWPGGLLPGAAASPWSWGFSLELGHLPGAGASPWSWGLSQELGLVPGAGASPWSWGLSQELGLVPGAGASPWSSGLSQELGLLPGAGACPRSWGFSQELGLLPGAGASPWSWGLSLELGLVPGAGASPRSWGFSLELGLLPGAGASPWSWGLSQELGPLPGAGASPRSWGLSLELGLLPGAGASPRSWGFSLELGRSRRWLPRLPQLVAALRADTPAHTVPNSQLIHQLGSPGGFLGSRCPAEGFQWAQGTSAPRASPAGGTFCGVPGGTPEGPTTSTGQDDAPHGPLGLRTRTPGLLCPWCRASREAWSRSSAEVSAPLLSGWVTWGHTSLPGRMGCHHPATTSAAPTRSPTAGTPGAAAPSSPACSAGIGGGFSRAENNASVVSCSRASSSQGSSSSGVNVPCAW